MNRHADKQALLPNARTVGKPAAVCELPTYSGLSETPRIDSYPIGGLPLCETEGVLGSFARMMAVRDGHTAGHCERLAFSGVALGAAMSLDSESLLSLYVGGHLHDVGKVSIPDSILFKPAQLTAEEWKIMRDHSVRGEEICRPLKSLGRVLPLIRHHHEKWDGSGYPDGLRGPEIPLLARVLQVVDIFDALTNPRPYKHAYSAVRALEILQEESDRGWRDKEICRLFIRIHTETQANSVVPGSMRDSLRNLQLHLQ